ncbi:hypothetical protein LTS18_012093 [Coniosporium uncinatum]|uniref:Uncharacterized protein n=1 Tax=Coniosporium uncinatum TaxID=93489 RepID=A0ACC3DVU6_9PEZI|nr:hypothetical protein LTS18_012093 [Coniosporium uncinatum]
MLSLTEDNIDDILYCARANDPTELSSLLSSLSSQHSCPQTAILLSAIDSESGNTVLHYAAANGHDAILTFFEKAVSGSQSDTSSTQWASPAHLAQPPSNSSSTTTPSSSSPSLVNVQNASNNTPLHWASLNGQLACVQKLVSLGADPRILNSAGHDAVFEAVRGDKAEVADWLLEKCGELEEGVGGRKETQDEGAREGSAEPVGIEEGLEGAEGKEGGVGMDMDGEIVEGMAVNGAVGMDGVNGDTPGQGADRGLGG